MDILNKPYEISFWQDGQDDYRLVETKIVTIGSDTMTSESRAIDPKFSCDINGTHQLTFKLYYQYIDRQTGETVRNYYADLLTNESKLKLHYEGEWYDFIIKSIVENSGDYTYTYTATDQFINELSKTGYNLEFSDELQNNMGTAKELCEATLAGTQWTVNAESDKIVQKQKEALFMCKIGEGGISGYELTYTANDGVEKATTTTPISGNKYVYVFYSCLANQTPSLQLIYLDGADAQIDSERILVNGTQYQVDGVTYGTKDLNYNVYVPQGMALEGLSNYRGERYVQSQKAHIDKKLSKVLYEYSRSGVNYYGFTTTTYESPSLLYDFVTNSSNFKSTSGWAGTKIGGNLGAPVGKIVYDTNPSIVEKFHGGGSLAGDYTPELVVSFPVSGSGTPAIVNSGFRDNIRQLKEIKKEEKFILYYSIEFSDRSGGTLPSDNPYVYAAQYDASTGGYPAPSNDTKYIEFDSTHQFSVGNNYYYMIGTASKSLSNEELKTTGLVLVIPADSTITPTKFYIHNLSVFRYIKDENGNPILPTSETVDAKIHTTYNYFPQSATYTSFDDIPNLESYDTVTDGGFTPIYNEAWQKIRSISVSKSNRFNIIQSICETFECWASFDIEHDEFGNITGKQVTLHNYIGQDTPIDFKYGINIKSISRTLDSKQLTSKLIVNPNSNEFGTNKFCTIARAANNPTGEISIYNFDYYVNKGMIDATTLDADLYKRPNGEIEWDENFFEDKTLGYYSFLNEINAELRALGEEASTLAVAISQTQAVIEKNQLQIQKATEEQESIDEKLRQYYQTTYAALKNYDPLSPSDDQTAAAFNKLGKIDNITYSILYPTISPTGTIPRKLKFSYTVNNSLHYYSNLISFKVSNADESKTIDYTRPVLAEWGAYRESGKTYTFTYTEDGDSNADYNKIVIKYEYEGNINTTTIGLNSLSWGTVILKGQMPQDSQLVRWMTSGIECDGLIEAAGASLANANQQYAAYMTRVTTIQSRQEELMGHKAILDKEFFKRYSRFIQEGTWIDEKYNDDELYYFDALSVGYEASVPKVTYQLSVLDLAGIEEYSAYNFKLGDRTYIQDEEFFGYTTINGVKSPAREQVTINKIQYALDDPSNNTITIQTYKSLFQDLFQRITATVQQVSYATGSYERAAALAEAATARKVEFLQDALNDAATVLTNLAEQSVVWDSTGITVTNLASPSEKLRIVSGGILLGNTDSNGEEKYLTAITANGISASVLTAGAVNTAVVQIMNGTEPTFRWDAYGLTAYDFKLDGLGGISNINSTSGVRFDRFGIYGFRKRDGETWHPKDIVTWDDRGQVKLEDNIRNYSCFELTKEGLYINLGEMTYGHYFSASGAGFAFPNPVTHTSSVMIGKVEDVLYNTVDYSNNPPLYYNPSSGTEKFAKVFEVKGLNSQIVMYDNGLLLANNIVATGGKIGGWILESNKLYGSYSDSGTKYAGINLPSSVTANSIIYHAGSSSSGGNNNSNFYVTAGGKLVAKAAQITVDTMYTYAQFGMWKFGNPRTDGAHGDADRYFYVDGTANPEYEGSGTDHQLMAFQKPNSGGLTAFAIGANNWESWASAPFQVKFDGTLTATGATIKKAEITSAVYGTLAGDIATINTLTVNNEAHIEKQYCPNLTVNNITGVTFKPGSSSSENVTYLIDSFEQISPSSFYVKVEMTHLISQTNMITGYNESLYVQIKHTGGSFSGSANFSSLRPTGPAPSSPTYFSGYVTMSSPIPMVPIQQIICQISTDNSNWSGRIDGTAIITTASFSGVAVKSDLFPNESCTNGSNGYSLGNDERRWKQIYVHTIYSVNPPFTSSDRRLKQNISSFTQQYDTFFDALMPIKYQWKEGDSIFRSGFIAQDVAAALQKAGLTSSDFYGYLDENPDSLALAYTEFISLNTWQIQKLKARVSELEQRCKELERRLL